MKGKRFILVVVAVVLVMSLISGCGSSSGGGDVKVGVGVVTSIAKSTGAAADKDGTAQVDSVIAAVAIDSAGKIVKVDIDSAQTRVLYDAKGEVKSDLAAEIKTKTELGADYGMIRASSIGKEWYEQIEDLEKWMVGKTINEIKGMKVDDAFKTQETDLVSKVTIGLVDYIKAVEKAVANAK